MKGKSANVSRTLSHLDFPRVMSHAIGIPARTSSAETSSAIVKEFAIAVSARPMSTGWSRTCPIVSHFIAMPSMGGIKISTRKSITAVMYITYLAGFFEESTFRASVILR